MLAIPWITVSFPVQVIFPISVCPLPTTLHHCSLKTCLDVQIKHDGKTFIKYCRPGSSSDPPDDGLDPRGQKPKFALEGRVSPLKLVIKTR